MVRTLSFALLIGLISVPFDGFAQALGFSDCDLTDDGRYVCIADSTGRYTFVTKEIYNLVNVASGTASEVQEDSATHPDLDKVKAEMEQIKKERLEAEAQRKKELREAKALSIKLEKEMTAMKEEQEERRRLEQAELARQRALEQAELARQRALEQAEMAKQRALEQAEEAEKREEERIFSELLQSYSKYVMVRECNELSKSYISKSELKTAKSQMKQIDGHYESLEITVDTKAAWKKASELFEEKFRDSFDYLAKKGKKTEKIASACKTNLEEIGTSVQALQNEKTTVEKDF